MTASASKELDWEAVEASREWQPRQCQMEAGFKEGEREREREIEKTH